MVVNAGEPGWRFAVDRGGTFTDIVAWGPDGRLYLHKVLSQEAGQALDPALRGIEAILDLAAPATTRAAAPARGAARIEWVRVGTTVATNALLERKGEPTLLVTTRGYADALRIGYQQRPAIFAREIRLPPPLYSGVVEASERVDAAGRIVVPLDEDALAAALREARRRGFDAVAICLMHAVVNAVHELRAAELARAAGFGEVVASHSTAALQGYVARGDTCVADAYLSPVLLRYVHGLEAAFVERGHAPVVSYMQSHGGLVDAAGFRGVNGVLSGPAGGVIGMVAAGLQSRESRLLGFDMGGTSTDVSLYAGELPRRPLTEIDGVRLQAPMMDVSPIAAGGGSIVRYHDGRLQVGPGSAGADPGPACYRRDGPATVTDCNVVLGRVQPELFPRVFGPARDEGLDVAASRATLERIADDVARDSASAYSVEELAQACVDIANASMANAVRELALRHGQDPARFSLVSFGGAGAQHACAIADALAIRRIVLHPLGGALSAYGIGLASRRALRRRSVERPLDAAGYDAATVALEAISHDARAALQRQGVAAGAIELRATAALRLPGSDTSIDVDWSTPERMGSAYAIAHRRLYGVQTAADELVIAAVGAEALERSTQQLAGRNEPAIVTSLATPSRRATTQGGQRVVSSWIDGAWRNVEAHDRSELHAGQTLRGPMLVADPGATIWIASGWTGALDRNGSLVLERTAERTVAGTETGEPVESDPQRLEVFNGIFMHVADQMGAVLRQTASSVNIKERLDFSCAIFDARTGLVANAPHMPVHLGSMGASVAAVVERFGDELRPGDAYLLNSPYEGGTHLPDLTVVTPVFDASEASLIAFVASRAHHADIGGVTPGSMPPWSRSIADEGVLIAPTRILRDGVLDEDALRTMFRDDPHPARDPDRNVADLRAQLAANSCGLRELERAAGEHGQDALIAYMSHVQDNAELCMRRTIRALRDGEFRYELDNRQVIAVRISVDASAGAATVDFTGTSPQLDNNFNAPRAVTVAAVLYVFRTLIDEPIPMNAGCLRPLSIAIPHGCMLDPTWPSAVVAGNVETSQCIVDALYGALGLQAAAQGTMNNFTFGNDRYQYYETIAGGSGAGPQHDGASGVQTHMTNSRLTDPEVLEHRFPVRLREFSVRRGSGGDGRHRGGDGLVRSVEFREVMTVAILSNHRRVAPFGLAGGRSGATGINRVDRVDGRRELLGGSVQIAVEPGDVVTLETPGGGGYGNPDT